MSTFISALNESQKIGIKSKKDSVDWHTAQEDLLKVEEELQELKDEIVSGNKLRQESELGDLLFSVAQLARHLNINSEIALKKTNDRFNKRFSSMMNLVEAKRLSWNKLNDSEKHKLWEEVKKEEKLTS